MLTIIPSVQVDMYTVIWSFIDFVIILMGVFYFARLQFWKLKSEPWWVKTLTICPVVLLASMAQLGIADMTAHFQGIIMPMGTLCFFFGIQLLLGYIGALRWQELEGAYGGSATSA